MECKVDLSRVSKVNPARDLIDTLWNVKGDHTFLNYTDEDDLIDTLWNVKLNLLPNQPKELQI